MITYNLSISLADECEISDDMYNVIQTAIDVANSRRNASRKGRHFSLTGKMDSSHLGIQLLSDSEVIPSRAMSAITRCIYSLDNGDIVSKHFKQNVSFITHEITPPEKYNKTSLTPVELLQEITSIIFGQSGMGNNRELAIKTQKEIEKIVLNYMNEKSIK